MRIANVISGILALAGFTILPISILIVAFSAPHSAKVDIKSEPAASAPAASAPEPAPVIPIQEALSSILRVSDRIMQVCYNGKNEKGALIFLIQYKPSPDDDFGMGWRFVDDMEFFQTNAGKWYTQAPNREEYDAVYPDITGLQCKQQ